MMKELRSVLAVRGVEKERRRDERKRQQTKTDATSVQVTPDLCGQ